MRNSSAPQLLAALFLLVALVFRAGAEEDPGALFMQVYQECRAAERLEAQGQFEAALQKFRFAVSLCEQLRQKHPEYQPLVTEFRLGESRKGIARVEAAMNVPASLPPLPADVGLRRNPVVAQPTLRARPSLRLPTRSGANEETRPSGRAFTGDESVVGRGADRVLVQELQILRDRLRDSERRASEFERRIQHERAQKLSAYRELDLTKVQVVELKSRLAQTGQKLADLEATRTADVGRVDELERALAETRADLEVAEEFNEELFAKVERAAEFIEASEKIRDQLLSERRQLAAEIAESSGNEAADLRTEVERLGEENRKFQEQLTGIPALEKENKDLEARLAEADARLDKSTEDREAAREIERNLREEIEGLNSTIARLRSEMEGGYARITELERQFEETSAATTSVTAAMASENALLKEIVERQLREQAKRQQVRKLLADEMTKLQVRSQPLIDGLDALAEAEAELSSNEQKLLRRPQVAVPTSGDGSSFEFAVIKPASAQGPAASIESNGVPATESRGPLRTALEHDVPGLSPGIAGNAVGDYGRTIDSFRRAISSASSARAALTHRGIDELRQGDIPAAKKLFHEAIESGVDTHLAHYFLGIALKEEGDVNAALMQVRRSLELEPGYQPALDLEQDLQAMIPPRAAAGGRR